MIFLVDKIYKLFRKLIRN